ncbi:unnamed protein product [Rangifer tarandus platyrhynchus]|uniref:Uncharacterized protein n=2 Tax=Rangifer tarandus platyrhynchus TaxID=3082113 RepID=A0ABN8Y047_RANTA|nr:unnamed protein product [Rangifer tarandus platyrhynchus]CAI9692623.1 unnamed protein product [Rangifer tarandus platyrhynchus]
MELQVRSAPESSPPRPFRPSAPPHAPPPWAPAPGHLRRLLNSETTGRCRRSSSSVGLQREGKTQEVSGIAARCGKQEKALDGRATPDLASE